jgi:hypothetical protein
MSAHPQTPQTRKLISARAIAAWAHRRDEILRKRRSGGGAAQLAMPCRHGGRRSRLTRVGLRHDGSVAIHPR